MDSKGESLGLIGELKYHVGFVYFIIFGIFYFLISWASEVGYYKGFNMDSFQEIYIGIMLLMPGITFSAITHYVNSVHKSVSQFKILVHLICSVIIYFCAVVLFLRYNQYFIASSLGSLLFLLLSKLLLAVKYPIGQLFVVAIGSGIVFVLPVHLLVGKSYSLGTSILLWTIVNGQFVHRFSRKHLKKESMNSV